VILDRRSLEARLRQAAHTAAGRQYAAAMSGLPRLASLIVVPPRDRRLGRFAQLFVGLVIYGLSSSLMVLGRHGLVPWDVLHQGLERQTGIAIGTWSILLGLVVLTLWIPLRERPGSGTIGNVIVIGGTIDLILWLVPPVHDGVARWACCLTGVVLSGIATGLYIGAGLGPGPRDGLMTGLNRRTGWSIRAVRTLIEAGVLALGWLLGGTVGVVTVIYLLAIGPLAHVFVPLFSRPSIALIDDPAVAG
jgi:uncharacterized membrane protein YczE